MFGSLDYVYMPSRDVARDMAYFTDVLGGRLVFAIDAIGARVAMIDLTEGPPRLLLADHVEGDRPILVYRVVDLEVAIAELTARGWQTGHRLEIPFGPVCSFSTPGGQRLAIYQRDMQRIVRMAGRGSLPRANAIEVVQGQKNDALQVGTRTDAQVVVDETDVLTVRGVLTSPVFRVDASDPTTFTKSSDEATLLIDSITKSAFSQPLGALKDIEPGEAILLVGSQGEAVYAVVSLIEIEFEETKE